MIILLKNQKFYFYIEKFLLDKIKIKIEKLKLNTYKYIMLLSNKKMISLD